MPGLIVHPATEIRRRSLLLRAGEHRLTTTVDPDTGQPGSLPNSMVESVDLYGDVVKVWFADGSVVQLDQHDHCEAVV